MIDADRLERLERGFLLLTRDPDGYIGANPQAGVELDGLVAEMRAEHTHRSGGLLVLD